MAAASKSVTFGDVNRKVRILARRGEVEVILNRLRSVRLQLQVHVASVLPVVDRDGPHRYLDQDVQFDRRRGGIGHHDLAAVDRLQQKLVRHELVDFLVADQLMTVAVAEEVLTDEYRRSFFARLRGADLLVEHDAGPSGDDLS